MVAPHDPSFEAYLKEKAPPIDLAQESIFGFPLWLQCALASLLPKRELLLIPRLISGQQQIVTLQEDDLFLQDLHDVTQYHKATNLSNPDLMKSMLLAEVPL